jgi:hypothetical protein
MIRFFLRFLREKEKTRVFDNDSRAEARCELVLGTNPNPTESGSGSFGLRIRSTKGSESSSPDPDPGAEASFPKLTYIFGNFAVFFLVCVTLLFSASYNMTETHIIRNRPFPYPNLHE